MRVGLVVNYIRHDSTYAALKAAPVIRDLGYTVTIFDKDFKSVTPKLHSFWDSFVVDGRSVSFKEWTDELDIVIWFTYPDERALEISSSGNRPNICVATWDSVDDSIVSLIKNRCTIVSPTKCQKNYFEQKWDVGTVYTIPTPVNLPITVSDRKPGKGLDLIVASPGYQVRRVDYDKLMVTIYQLCENFDNLRVRILYSKKVASQGKTYLDKYARWFENSSSISTVDDLTGWSEGPVIYATCDLVLWPTQIDGFNYVAREAMAMGTPVAVYGAMPMVSGITNGKNGFVIPCAVHHVDTGTPYAVHDGPGIMEVVENVIKNPDLLTSTRANLSELVLKEENNARQGWSSLLDTLSTAGPTNGKTKG